MEVTVKAKFNRTAPRKLRLVADLVRGWDAQKALQQLRFIPKAAAQDLTKTLQSAIGAAKESNLDVEKAYIKYVMINEGPVLKRRVYASRGRAQGIKKRMSHIVMTLAERIPAEEPVSKQKVTEIAEATPEKTQVAPVEKKVTKTIKETVKEGKEK